MAASKNITTRSRIRWSANNKTLYFDGRALQTEKLIGFVNDMLNRAEALLSEYLLFQSNGHIPEFDLSVVDDPSNHVAGHYFAQDKLSAWKHARLRMMNRLQESNEWFEIVEVNGERLDFCQHGIDRYNKWDRQFRELLAILMMITCGLSGRGTEMTSLRYMNSMDGDRNIYIEDGQVMFITEYHKSMALMDDMKVIVLKKSNTDQ